MQRPERCRGLSAIEILITIFVLTVLGGAIAVFQGDLLALNRGVSGSLVAQGEMQKVLRTIASELRAASPSSGGAYPIGQAATSSIIFYSNVDTDALKERLRYFVEEGNLKRGVIKPTGNPLVYNPINETVNIILQYVANATGTPVFEYYDSAYDGTGSPLTSPVDIPSIRLVKMTLVVDRDMNAPPTPFVFSTQVSLRNLKDNL